MIFTETGLTGAFVIDLDIKSDDRGFFARTWCQKEFEEHGQNPRLVQCNISFSKLKGTMRGIDLQDPPYAEAKLVRCTRGSLYDVVLDLRPESPTFKQHFAAILTAENHRAIYIPEGCGHGFLTLEDNTETYYQMSEFYAPQFERGVRWNDPAFAIPWPGEVRVVSERHRTYSDFV